MEHIPVKLLDFSLRRMRHIMCLLLVHPPRPQLQLNLLYNMTLLVYLIIISRWRFGFQYMANYDYLHDHLSRHIDLANFVALFVGHLIVAMELIWRNQSVHIDEDFQKIQVELREKLGRKVNLRRFQKHSNIIYYFIFLRLTTLFVTTMYNYVTTKTFWLLIGNLYSETVLILRCSEFTLHLALVLAIYQELHDASSQVISELETKKLLSLQRIIILQELHQLLWQTQRAIESNFEHSLIVIMMKHFLDTSIIPYWIYLSRNLGNLALTTWCLSEEVGKILEMFIPCWICTRCEHLQRKFRSLFHGVSNDRRNEEINMALLAISTQLGQERCRFRIGGLITVNHDMLGKFLFGVVSYIFICIQFRINKDGQDLEAKLLHNHTLAWF